MTKKSWPFLTRQFWPWYWEHLFSFFKDARSKANTFSGWLVILIPLILAASPFLAGYVSEIDTWVKWLSTVVVVTVTLSLGALSSAFQELKEKDAKIATLSLSAGKVVFLDDLVGDVKSGDSLHYKARIKNVSISVVKDCVVSWDFSTPTLPNVETKPISRTSLAPQETKLFDFLRIEQTSGKWYASIHNHVGIEIPKQIYHTVRLKVVGDNIQEPEIQELQVSPLNGRALVIHNGQIIDSASA